MNTIHNIKEEVENAITEKCGAEGYINFNKVFEQMLKIIHNVIDSSDVESRMGDTVEAGVDISVTNPDTGFSYRSLTNNEVITILEKISGITQINSEFNYSLYIDTELCQLVFVPSMEQEICQGLECNLDKMLFISIEEFELITNTSGGVAVFIGGEILYSNTSTIAVQDLDDGLIIFDDEVIEMSLMF